jgi:enterochelin esterase-like enzyme
MWQMSNMKPSRPRVLGALFLILGVASIAVVTASASGESHPTRAAAHTDPPAQLGPQVIYTGRPPTGYDVKFRYSNPTATSVLIKGAWGFASEESEANDQGNVPVSATSTSAPAAVIPPGGPILPAQWKFGDFQLQSPDSPSENWPVAAMTKDPRTGLWTYTVPLPAGWFDYQFFPNCTSATTTGCTSVTDPANPPQLTACSACDQSSTAPFSEVYVRSDARFDPVNLSWQSNPPASERGNLVDLSFPDSQSSTGSANLAVYTPPGYDPHRSVPYPLFIATHGGGENELAWADRGMIEQIVDHALAAHEMQPAVIVMPNGSGNFQTDITNEVIPWVEQNYDVSKVASGRAFVGTSAFGTQANNFMFNDTSEFGYYGPFSPAAGAPPLVGVGAGYPAGPPTAPAYQIPALKQVLGIDLAIGQFDLGGNAPQATAMTERIGLINAGVPFRYFSVDGGHSWTFWRLALQDFLTHTLFRTTTTSATLTVGGSGDTVSVSVSAATTEPAVPSGTAQVFVTSGAVGDCTAGGSCYPVAVGAPVRLHNGGGVIHLASGTIPSGQAVTVQYSGDNYYNSSTSAATTAP